MDKSGILEFINKNPVTYLATCEGAKPHVRGMLMYRADEKGIIFHTGTSKDLHRQLERNPQVELCIFSQQDNKQVRISGRMEELKDESVKKEIVQNRPFLKPWIEKQGLNFLSVWRLKDGMACVWTMEKNLEPKEYIKI